jgi:EEF1A N-terminal glycine/lysine methyltransferase
VEIYSRELQTEDRGPKDVKIHLVGQHPLWGHHLWVHVLLTDGSNAPPLRWNASKIFAAYLDTHWVKLCHHKRILELGAGGGLPGLIAAFNHADSVRILFQVMITISIRARSCLQTILIQS